MDGLSAARAEATPFARPVHTEGTDEAELRCIEGRYRSTVFARFLGPGRSGRTAGFTVMHFRRIRPYAGHLHYKVADTAKLLPNPVAAHVPLTLALLARNYLHGVRIVIGVISMITNDADEFEIRDPRN